MTSRALGNSSIVRGLAADDQLRWFAVDVGAVAHEAMHRHDFGPLAAMAFGRASAAAALISRSTAKTPHRLTLEAMGSGPLRKVSAQITAEGGLRGSVAEPHAVLEGEEALSVSEGLGVGLLQVRREHGDGRTYESRVELVSSGLAEDVAHYLRQSEQRRTAVLLGVYLEPSGVAAAGGLLVEALPGADDETIAIVERQIGSAPSIGQCLQESGVGRLVERVLGPLQPRDIGGEELEFSCGCSRASVRSRLAALSRAEVEELTAPSGDLDAECAFCGDVYRFQRAELMAGSGADRREPT